MRISPCSRRFHHTGSLGRVLLLFLFFCILCIGAADAGQQTQTGSNHASHGEDTFSSSHFFTSGPLGSNDLWEVETSNPTTVISGAKVKAGEKGLKNGVAFAVSRYSGLTEKQLIDAFNMGVFYYGYGSTEGRDLSVNQALSTRDILNDLSELNTRLSSQTPENYDYELNTESQPGQNTNFEDLSQYQQQNALQNSVSVLVTNSQPLSQEEIQQLREYVTLFVIVGRSMMSQSEADMDINERTEEIDRIVQEFVANNDPQQVREALRTLAQSYQSQSNQAGAG